MEIVVNAKINLSLEVVGLREDAYHNLQSIIQTISLADQMFIEKTGNIEVDGNGHAFMAEKSLVLRAAYLFKERTGYEGGACIFVDKNIPFGSGMGSDSAGAAAVLKYLNVLWGMRWPLEELALLAGELGSDVPFFIWGGTALLSGRGDNILVLPKIPRTYFCAVFPKYTTQDKTYKAYKAIDSIGFDNGAHTETFRLKLETSQAITANDYYNSFDRVASILYPEHEKYSCMMRIAGASKVMLAGSGSALICPCDSENEALKICLSLLAQGINAVTFYTT